MKKLIALLSSSLLLAALCVTATTHARNVTQTGAAPAKPTKPMPPPPKSDSDIQKCIQDKLAKAKTLGTESITVTVADEAKKWILNQTLTDRSYGARPLRRALQKYIEDPLSEALIQGTITTRPAFIEVFLEDNKLFYRPVDSEKAEGVLLYEN